MDTNELRDVAIKAVKAPSLSFMAHYLQESAAIIDELRFKARKIQEVVSRQAAAEGLWFPAQTAPEAYLQDALRKLHRAIEE